MWTAPMAASAYSTPASRTGTQGWSAPTRSPSTPTSGSRWPSAAVAPWFGKGSLLQETYKLIPSYLRLPPGQGFAGEVWYSASQRRADQGFRAGSQDLLEHPASREGRAGGSRPAAHRPGALPGGGHRSQPRPGAAGSRAADRGVLPLRASNPARRRRGPGSTEPGDHGGPPGRRASVPGRHGHPRPFRLAVVRPPLRPGRRARTSHRGRRPGCRAPPGRGRRAAAGRG